ncbi:MAG: GNAT family N-acetyltransferase [Proteobacteria bacterium]|nr:GNAT family N-acetyltransferase [Pseudomonadota bacterium]
MAATGAEGGFPPLTTERLVVRRLEDADAATVHRLINDWEVAGKLSRVPFPFPPKDVAAWIRATHAALAKGREFALGVALRAEGDLVGVVGLIVDETRTRADLGYWIGRAYWNRGYATESVRRLVEFAFVNLGLERLWAVTLVENDASARVLRKLGFRHEGLFKHDFPARGEVKTVNRYALTRTELRRATPASGFPAGGGARPVVLVAAVALIDADDRVLIARRPEGKAMAGLWEFPGGKVHADETPEQALIRELKEELAIDVEASCLAPLTFASHAYEGFHLLMPLYVCRVWGGTLRPREGQEVAWVRVGRLGDYPMPPADKPLVAMLRDFL